MKRAPLLIALAAGGAVAAFLKGRGRNDAGQGALAETTAPAPVRLPDGEPVDSPRAAPPSTPEEVPPPSTSEEEEVSPPSTPEEAPLSSTPERPLGTPAEQARERVDDR